jgi:palmitoyltransferase
MIFVFYYVITPQLYKWTSSPVFLLHFMLGNWLAVNTVFHYFMGWRTNPGNPPKAVLFDNVTTMCRKCVAPKPPRAHHCSVCSKCVLKMDHHCPWFDNCIGFNNHRYFFLFCTFMSIDCLYLVTFGYYYYQKYIFPYHDYSFLGLMLNKLVPDAPNQTVPGNLLYYQITTVEFFVAFGAMFALGALASFNFFIISNGATNIEIKSIRIPCFSRPYAVTN